ncbi:hypothetical protein ColKHC_01735 [Colletotrichum higginsianum]|nr:hypothetical protein ColKHC_01735 [Colletotrichum higginsianum]
MSAVRFTSASVTISAACCIEDTAASCEGNETAFVSAAPPSDEEAVVVVMAIARIVEVKRRRESVGGPDIGSAQAGDHLLGDCFLRVLFLHLAMNHALDKSVEDGLGDANSLLPLAKHAALGVPLGEHADVSHDAQVDRHRLEPPLPPIRRQRVLVRVPGRVRRLARVAYDARYGRAHGEEVEGPVGAKVLVQVARPGHLGPQRLRPLRRGLIGRVGSIGAGRDAPARGQLAQQRPRLGRGVTGARKEGDVTGTGGGKVPGQTATEAAHATDQEVCGVRVEAEQVGSALEHGGARVVVGLARRVEGEDGLAGVFTLLHDAEDLLDLAGAVRLQRVGGREVALLDKAVDLAEDGTEILEGVVEDVAEGERRVLDKGPHVERRVVGNVAQADLDKGAKGRETARVPRGAQQLVGERVEDAVDAAPPGDALDALDEAEVARVEDVRLGNPEALPHELPLALGADGHVRGQLDGGLSDTTGRGVDQDRLALAQLGQPDERVVRRDVYQVDGGALFEGDGVGQLVNDGVVSPDGGGMASVRVGRNTVAGLDIADCGAGPDDDAAGFQAQHRHGNQPHGAHDVLEVDARGAHADLDVRVGERLECPLILDKVQRVQQPGTADGQADG